MRIEPDKAHMVNAMVIGHILTYLAIFLNIAEGKTLGVVMAILALTCCYFQASILTYIRHNRTADILGSLSILLVVLSYANWLFF